MGSRPSSRRSVRSQSSNLPYRFRAFDSRNPLKLSPQPILRILERLHSPRMLSALLLILIFPEA